PLRRERARGGRRQRGAAGGGAQKFGWCCLAAYARARSPANEAVPFTGLRLPHLDIDQSLDLHIAGTVEVTLADVFTATAAGAVDLGQLALASNHAAATAAGFTGAGPIQATVVSLQASGAGGGVTASVDVKLISLSQGANSWLGVQASGI